MVGKSLEVGMRNEEINVNNTHAVRTALQGLP